MNKRNSYGPIATTAFLVLALLVSVYVGSFYALVNVEEVYYGPQFIFWDYSYRMKGDFNKGFYWPMEQIDRRIRPDGDDDHGFPTD